MIYWDLRALVVGRAKGLTLQVKSYDVRYLIKYIYEKEKQRLIRANYKPDLESVSCQSKFLDIRPGAKANFPCGLQSIGH